MGPEAVAEREAVSALSGVEEVMAGLEPGVMREVSNVDGVGEGEEKE